MSQAFSIFTPRLPFLSGNSSNARDLSTRFSDTINVKDFGAVGDGVTDDYAAIQAALDVNQDSGDKLTVYVPAGNYLIGSLTNGDSPLNIHSNTTLHLDKGAKLIHNLYTGLGMIVNDDYLLNVDAANGAYTAHNPTTYSSDHDIVIDGGTFGTSAGKNSSGTQGRTFNFWGVTNLRLINNSIEDKPAGNWHTKFKGVTNLVIQGLRIKPGSYALLEDGIHLVNCANVIISDCDISSGDDCISITTENVSEFVAGETKNVVISNCNLTGHSRIIVMETTATDSITGWNLLGSIHDVTVSNIKAIVGISGAIQGNGIQLLNSGVANGCDIYNIKISNVLMDETNSVNIYSVWLKNIRNVSLNDVYLHNNRSTAVFGDSTANLSLINVHADGWLSASQASQNTSGFSFNNGATNLLIQGCTIDGAPKAGISVNTPTSGRNTNIRIIGNTVQNCAPNYADPGNSAFAPILIAATDGAVINGNRTYNNGIGSNSNVSIGNGCTQIAQAGNAFDTGSEPLLLLTSGSGGIGNASNPLSSFYATTGTFGNLLANQSSILTVNGAGVQLLLTNGINDGVAKQARAAFANYNTTAGILPVGIFTGTSGTTDNLLVLGGGNSNVAAVNRIGFATAGDGGLNTATGTTQWLLEDNGNFYTVNGSATLGNASHQVANSQINHLVLGTDWKIGTASGNTVSAEITKGSLSLLFGDSVTDATTKIGRVGSLPYTIAQVPVATLHANNTSSNNILNIGGGTSLFQALTQFNVYTASAQNTTTGTQRLRITGAGSVVIGDNTNALATNATDGFLYVPTCAGTPTGTPTTQTNTIPLVYDTTDRTLWYYTGGTWRPVAVEGRSVVTYSASMTPDMANGNYFVIAATDTSAFTINALSHPIVGRTFQIRVTNSSGGALGTITWDSSYKLAGSFTAPANGKSRLIEFKVDTTGPVCYEINRTAADI